MGMVFRKGQSHAGQQGVSKGGPSRRQAPLTDIPSAPDPESRAEMAQKAPRLV